MARAAMATPSAGGVSESSSPTGWTGLALGATRAVGFRARCNTARWRTERCCSAPPAPSARCRDNARACRGNRRLAGRAMGNPVGQPDRCGSGAPARSPGEKLASWIASRSVHSTSSRVGLESQAPSGSGSPTSPVEVTVKMTAARAGGTGAASRKRSIPRRFHADTTSALVQLSRHRLGRSVRGAERVLPTPLDGCRLPGVGLRAGGTGDAIGGLASPTILCRERGCTPDSRSVRRHRGRPVEVPTPC